MTRSKTPVTMRAVRLVAVLAAATLFSGAALDAQTPANDPSARLREVLPADVAERVLAKIAEARARQLPAAALENRALKFAAKGVAPAEIERSVSEQADRMVTAKSALAQGRGRPATDEEVEAGADALRKGVDGAQVSALAKNAPSGRSLAVPLYVVGSLVDRGLPSDAALQRVQERLQARASDVELERLPAQLPTQAAAGQAHRPTETGRELAATKRPSGVPANGGAGARPTAPAAGQRPTGRP
jgi:hypothetical protein